MRDNVSTLLMHNVIATCISTAALETWRTRAWTDDTTPRTDRPVRFSRGLHQYESLQYGQLRATFRFSPSFIAR